MYSLNPQFYSHVNANAHQYTSRVLKCIVSGATRFSQAINGVDQLIHFILGKV